MPVTLLEECQYACHGEHGQVSADGSPFSEVGGEQVRASRHVGNQEQAQQDSPDTGAVAVSHHVHAEQVLGNPIVCQNRQSRRQQNDTGDHHANDCLQQNEEKLFQRCVEIL